MTAYNKDTPGKSHTCCLLCCCLRLFRATEGCITSCLQDASMPIALIFDTRAMAVWRLQAAQPEHDIIVISSCMPVLLLMDGGVASQPVSKRHISHYISAS